MSDFSIKQRIYYEDTDAGGVVYYANYLKFYERCRTEYLRYFDFNQSKLREQYGILFVVKHVDINYLKPALLDDEITIDLKIKKQSKAAVVFKQTINKKESLLNEATVTIVCIDSKTMKTTRIPLEINFK